MTRKRTPPSTAELHENIGRGVLALAAAMQGRSNGIVTYQDQINLGAQVEKLVRAAVKAAIPGRQTNAQVKAINEAARQAFARALARQTAHLAQPPQAQVEVAGP